MVESTTKRLRELKSPTSSSTWFNDHSLVFTDTAQLGERNIAVTDEDKTAFVEKVYCPYLQSFIDCINGRMESTELNSFMSVFDPRYLPDKEEDLSNYGMEKMKMLIKFYGTMQRVQLNEMEGVSQPDIEPDETE